MQILDGREVSEVRREALKGRVESFVAKTGRPPGLAVVLVGEDPASQVYVGGKERACNQIGLASFRHDLPDDTAQARLHELLVSLNEDDSVDGILVQFPLPGSLDKAAVLKTLRPDKDADGLAAENLGLLWGGRPRVSPCTPSGVMSILKHYDISVEGKTAVVVGRSHLVGLPMAQLLQLANATVTICHSRTPDVSACLQRADIAVLAAGQPRMFGASDFKKDAVVIDVGIHRLEEPLIGVDGKSKKLCGDVRFEELEGVASAATPVPGGVGPMTITTLLENTVRLAELRFSARD